MTPARVIGTAMGVGALALGAVVLGSVLTGDPVAMFTRDLRALSRDAGLSLPFYAGSVSVLNGWVWAATATLSALAGALDRSRRVWMLVFAALLLLLGADDALMLHEYVGPRVGVPEVAFYVVYAATAGGLLVASLRRRDATTVAFLLGGAFLATSVLTDVTPLSGSFLFEDGVKLLGALTWLTVPLLDVTALWQQRSVAEPTAEPVLGAEDGAEDPAEDRPDGPVDPRQDGLGGRASAAVPPGRGLRTAWSD